MKFSENWLRQHVKTDATTEQLSATLTDIGLEVEEATALGSGLDHVIVARIADIAPHPEADRLRICQVDAGQDVMLQIVCGAPNARLGLKAPLAMLGAKLGDLTIKPAKLRGVESNGMLCSAKELGLDNDASGLMELPDDAPVGRSIRDYLQLPDTQFELKLTPNRADCFSIRGIAFDVAAATQTTVQPYAIPAIAAMHDTTLHVELNAEADAPRYIGRVIRSIDPQAKTPVWMAQRLQRSGIRPLSFLVDVTQYVMLELGQPMHAYDFNLLKGPVGVRYAREAEQLKLLDGKEVTLKPNTLVITDADRAIGVAGIMGGFDTRVTDTTHDVFLEAAYFAPSAIIGRARQLGLHTDASHRFERGVDPQLCRQAIELATALILEHAGGQPGPVSESVRSDDMPTPKTVALRHARVERVLGKTFDKSEVERIFTALGFSVTETGEGWSVVVPTRRFDIDIEEDLIEEIARIHGYNNIPATLPAGATRLALDTEAHLPVSELRRRMIARDYFEAINYAFVDEKLLQTWNMQADTIPLANPLTSELGVMRPALLPGLVDAMVKNQTRQQERVRLFEYGNVFLKTASDSEPQQINHLAAIATGTRQQAHWDQSASTVDFYDLKADLESLAAFSGITLTYQPSTSAYGHPGRSADVYVNDKKVGWIGELHPQLRQALDLDQTAVGFEIDAESLRNYPIPSATSMSKFPSVRRDLAFVVAEEVSWQQIKQTVQEVAGDLLRYVELFDRYVGKGVENNQKSLAMGLILQDFSRTLTDQDIENTVTQVVRALETNFGARLRG